MRTGSNTIYKSIEQGKQTMSDNPVTLLVDVAIGLIFVLKVVDGLFNFDIKDFVHNEQEFQY